MADAVTTTLTGSETLRTVIQPPPVTRSVIQPQPVIRSTIAVGQGPAGKKGDPGNAGPSALELDPGDLTLNFENGLI